LQSSCDDFVYWQKFYDIVDGLAATKPYGEGFANCCHVFTKQLIHDQLQTFMELMKQTMVANIKIRNSNSESPSMKNSVFVEKYLNNTAFVKAFNLSLTAG